MTDEPEDAAPRIRSRTAPAAPAEGAQTGGRIGRTAAPQNNASGGGDWMKSGSAARDTQQAELARNQERERKRAEGIFMPYRFWLPVGKQVELVVLDEQPGPCFFEHNLQDPGTGKWDVYESCPKETEVCPLCDGVAGGKESYYVMLLTAMVMDPYINKNGITVPHSRKLLAVKTNEQPFFLRQFDQHGTLRGLQFLMARDSKQSPNIGRAELIGTGPHSEADILATFGHAAVTDQQGKVLKQANADCYAFPYAKIFTRPSGEDLRRRYGGVAPMGSRADVGQSFSGGSRIQPGGGAATGGNAGGFAEDIDDDVPF